MVTKDWIGLAARTLAFAALLTGCSTGGHEEHQVTISDSERGAISRVPREPAPRGPSVPCDGKASVAQLLQDRPNGTIAVTVVVPVQAPKVTNLGGSEVRAVYSVSQVEQVAGPPVEVFPQSISALLAEQSVPVFLPQGRYLLLVYPDPQGGSWTVLSGLPGEFEVVATDSVRERCALEGVVSGHTQAEVIKAAAGAPHGPVESLADVVSALIEVLH